MKREESSVPESRNKFEVRKFSIKSMEQLNADVRNVELGDWWFPVRVESSRLLDVNALRLNAAGLGNEDSEDTVLQASFDVVMVDRARERE